MGTLLLVALWYVVPVVVAFFWFRWSEPTNKLDLPARVIFLVGVIVFLAKMGLLTKNGAYGSYVWTAGVLVGALSLVPRTLALPLAHELRDLLRAGALAGAGILLVVFGFAKAAAAREAPEPPVHLTFPLHGGTYLVLEGGNGSLFGLAVEGSAQRFGVDVVKVDALGFRASSLWPTEPEAFVIFDDAVSAPCDGNILAAEDDKPDLSPSQADSLSPLGNFVAIGCPEATVVLTHLKRGSLKTPKNVTVHVGEALARVGSSGNGGEAKLRIFAVHGSESAPDRLAAHARGVPMAFGVVGDGAFVRGDRLTL